MDKKEQKDAHTIEPGMVVETTRGDLGEEDVSKPRVTDVVRDQSGNVAKVVVKKDRVSIPTRSLFSHVLLLRLLCIRRLRWWIRLGWNLCILLCLNR